MSKLKLIASLIIVIVIVIVIMLFREEADINVVGQDNKSVVPDVISSTLRVLPQKSDVSVKIDSVTLNDPGFIAIRALENNRLGQIIEISPYLAVGLHRDIEVQLGDFYDGGKELIVMLYQDAGDDQVFNDLDQPMLDNKKNIIAKYVESGESVPMALMQPSVNEIKSHVMGEMKMETVRYTNGGYEPKLLEVTVGTMVQFVNDSDEVMWVASNEHPAHTDLPTFDQFKPSPVGSNYAYTFDEVGTWSYHDHINPEREGVIQVIN